MNTWRDKGTQSIAAVVASRRLPGLRRTATATPGEAVVVIRNGKVQGLQAAGQIKTVSVFDRLRSAVRIGPDVQVLMVDTSTFTLSYWIEDPNVPRIRQDGESLGLPVLTKDGQLISAQINVNLSVAPEESELLLQAMRGQSSLSTFQLGDLLKDQLISQVVGLQVSAHNADELRGNSDLLRHIDSEAGLQLKSRLSGYGLKFEGLNINWGLTQSESSEIEKLRRVEERAKAQHEAEIEGFAPDAARDSQTIVHGNVSNTVSSGLGGVWIIGLVTVVLIGIITILVLVVDN